MLMPVKRLAGLKVGVFGSRRTLGAILSTRPHLIFSPYHMLLSLCVLLYCQKLCQRLDIPV